MHKTNVKIPYENCVVCAFNNPVFGSPEKSISEKETTICLFSTRAAAVRCSTHLAMLEKARTSNDRNGRVGNFMTPLRLTQQLFSPLSLALEC